MRILETFLLWGLLSSVVFYLNSKLVKELVVKGKLYMILEKENLEFTHSFSMNYTHSLNEPSQKKKVLGRRG